MAALERELLNRGHKVSRELSVRVTYKGEELGSQRLDMVVDDVLVDRGEVDPYPASISVSTALQLPSRDESRARPAASLRTKAPVPSRDLRERLQGSDGDDRSHPCSYPSDVYPLRQSGQPPPSSEPYPSIRSTLRISGAKASRFPATRSACSCASSRCAFAEQRLRRSTAPRADSATSPRRSARPASR